jgi:hypothetical protein
LCVGGGTPRPERYTQTPKRRPASTEVAGGMRVANADARPTDRPTDRPGLDDLELHCPLRAGPLRAGPLRAGPLRDLASQMLTISTDSA